MATKKRKKKSSKKVARKPGKKVAAKSRKKAATKAPKKKPAARRAAARTSSGTRGGLSIRSAAPSLTVNDIEASLAFYRDVLGFAAKGRWEDQGRLLGVEMLAGKVSFMLTQDDWQKGRDREKGQGVRLYCTTDQDVDQIATRIKAKGGTLAHEPRDEWGVRAISLADLDGYKITIARNLKK